jgi:tRNA(Glu) U13 pseudouridine synthase TruD
MLAGRWEEAVAVLLDPPVVALSSVGRTPAEALVTLLATGDAAAAAEGLSATAHRDAVALLAAMRRVQRSPVQGAIDAASPAWREHCRAAFDHVPFALKQLWLHAAQSLVFNKLLSALLAAGVPVPPQLPLLGAGTMAAALHALPQLADVLAELQLSSGDFTRTVAGVPLRGSWRPSFAVPRNVAVSAGEGSCVVLSFELPSSAYATILLREILGYVPSE